MQPIIIATTNPGKAAELGAPLAALGLRALTLADFPHLPEIAETGSTFEENARLKAAATAEATGLVSIADDSGLLVDALQGAPGIYSARYGDDWELLPGESRDGRNIRKLLAAMERVPEPMRQCRFASALVCARPAGAAICASGFWEGLILREARGSGGFGYDPVFLDPDLGKTAAELTREEKNARSHRGRAITALMAQLPAFLQLS